MTFLLNKVHSVLYKLVLEMMTSVLTIPHWLRLRFSRTVTSPLLFDLLVYCWAASCSIRKCSGALESVLERPEVPSMIGYTTLTYVPRDSPQRSVHLAVRAWDDLLESATRAGLARRDPQRDEPAAVRDGMGRINPFDISTLDKIRHIINFGRL
ncbi:uncharacterized protein LOC106419441 [Brassica napus]|uniref:uncharacterized protein LOC106419441 n=1 Tax=Brassica napus TaxID=3708 RepID=UPI002078A970|nr:uncharacterized protein LOC106419441 [Brassica napus]